MVPSVSMDSGNKWRRAAASMVPADSDTRDSNILLRNCWFMAIARTPTKEPELIMRVEKMTDHNSLDMMSAPLTFIT